MHFLLEAAAVLRDDLVTLSVAVAIGTLGDEVDDH